MNHNTLLNRSRQLNPCDHLFWKSRGYLKRPPNWKQVLIDSGYYDNDDDDYYDSAKKSHPKEESHSEVAHEGDHSTKNSDEEGGKYKKKRSKPFWQNKPYSDLRDFLRDYKRWQEMENRDGKSTETKSTSRNEWWKNGKNRI